MLQDRRLFLFLFGFSLARADDPIYTPGPDIKLPKLIHYVEPEFNTDSRQAYVEGTVRLSVVVTTEGKPTRCKVTRGLTDAQDRAALKAVDQWRFEPGTKDGKPVNVQVTVEVGFHLL